MKALFVTYYAWLKGQLDENRGPGLYSSWPCLYMLTSTYQYILRHHQLPVPHPIVFYFTLPPLSPYSLISHALSLTPPSHTNPQKGHNLFMSYPYFYFIIVLYAPHKYIEWELSFLIYLLCGVTPQGHYNYVAVHAPHKYIQ